MLVLGVSGAIAVWALATQTAPESGNVQPAPKDTTAIIITGSRIPRRNLTAVSPVTMVKGEEVKFHGASLTEDLINQLPQVTPDQGASISAGSSGTRCSHRRA